MPGIKHRHPPLYHRIVKHLMEKGFSEDHAWPTAKNIIKKGCETGDVNFPGLQQMNKISRAKYCAAYAEYKRRNPGSIVK